jgi:hypothetical protein
LDGKEVAPALPTVAQTVNVLSNTDPVVRKVTQLLEGFSLNIRSTVSDGIAQGFASQRSNTSLKITIYSYSTICNPHPSLLTSLHTFFLDPNTTFKIPK